MAVLGKKQRECRILYNMYRVMQEGNVSVLGADIIGHCEKKSSSHENVSNSEWLPK